VADDHPTKPSRESMREVKREFKERQKAERERARAAQAYWEAETGRATSGGGRSRGPGRSGAAAGLVVVVAFSVVGATAVLHVGPFAPSSSAASAPPAATVASTPTPSPTSPAASPGPSTTGDGTDPTVVAAFQDSPARTWKSGTAGIVMPRARQVGIYGPAQVAEAYRKTASYIAAIMLNHRVLYQAKLDPVFAALAPPSVTWLKSQHARSVSTHGKSGLSWAQVAVRFHPGDWKAAAETRIRGKVSPTIYKDGSLEIAFTYVAAYWLVPSGGGAPRTIAVRIEGGTYFRGRGAAHVTGTYAGGLGVTSSANVCGSDWAYPDFTEAWTDPDSVTVASAPPVTGSVDLSDPDATMPPGRCFTDTSGFRG
jgi:hypothetical protein